MRVTTPGGTTADTASDNYTYNAVPVPTVTGVSPTSGSTGGATSVIITGTNFAGATAVSFGGNGRDLFHGQLRHPDHRHGARPRGRQRERAGHHAVRHQRGYGQRQLHLRHPGAGHHGAESDLRLRDGRQLGDRHRDGVHGCHRGGVRRNERHELHRQLGHPDNGCGPSSRRRIGPCGGDHGRRDLTRHLGRRLHLQSPAGPGNQRAQPGQGPGDGQHLGGHQWH